MTLQLFLDEFLYVSLESLSKLKPWSRRNSPSFYIPNVTLVQQSNVGIVLLAFGGTNKVQGLTFLRSLLELLGRACNQMSWKETRLYMSSHDNNHINIEDEDGEKDRRNGRPCAGRIKKKFQHQWRNQEVILGGAVMCESWGSEIGECVTRMQTHTHTCTHNARFGNVLKSRNTFWGRHLFRQARYTNIYDISVLGLANLSVPFPSLTKILDPKEQK